MDNPFFGGEACAISKNIVDTVKQKKNENLFRYVCSRNVILLKENLSRSAM